MKYCPKCNTETEREKRGRCKPCNRAANASYRAANPEKERARRAAHYAANPDKMRASSAAWKASNPEKNHATHAAWKAANPERVIANGASWRAANPEKRRICEQNRRARKIEAGGKLSPCLAEKLFQLQKGKCPCCKHPLGDDFHMDHKMPLALGGSNTDDNIQLLRSTCNQQKHVKHPVDFMRQRGFLL